MREYTRSTTAVADRETPSASIEVEVHDRWDALALSKILIPYHSFLVHHEGQRWVVHALAPGCHGESLNDALRTIEDWLVEHRLDGTSCRVGGQPYRLGPRERK
jgi:hypothetical protein